MTPLSLRCSARPSPRACLLAACLSLSAMGSAAGRPDSRSLAYLDSLRLDALETIRAPAGRPLRIVDRLPIREEAGDDLVAGLRSVAITVTQVSGPPVTIEHADNARARAVMPVVDVPTPVVFEIGMRNAGGERRGRLTVIVQPGR